MLIIFCSVIVCSVELLQATSFANRRVHEFLLKYHDTPLGLLLDGEENIKTIFAAVDTDHSGEISLGEWKSFLAQLIEQDLTYIVRKGWARNKCYWAINPPTQPPPKFCFLNMEFLLDFWYFEQNTNHLLGERSNHSASSYLYVLILSNHLFEGVFLADKRNPLTKFERFVIEFCCQSYILLSSALSWQGNTNPNNRMISFIFVTIPSIFLRMFLDYIFKCPCLVRRHQVGCARRCLFPILECLGHLVGFAVFLIAIVFLAVGITFALSASPGFGNQYIYTWITSYLWAVVFDIVVMFNPFLAVKRFAQCCICLKWAGFAKWQFEREYVLQKLNHDCLIDQTGMSEGASELPHQV